MNTMQIKRMSALALAALALGAIISALAGEKTSSLDDQKKEVIARLAEIQNAAQALDVDKVFSYVSENDNGALVQNGRILLTRSEALESTRQGFRGLAKIEYRFNQQRVTMLSPKIALAVGEGVATATTGDGNSFNRPFSQSVLLVQTNGEWMVFHAHRSTPPTN